MRVTRSAPGGADPPEAPRRRSEGRVGHPLPAGRRGRPGARRLRGRAGTAAAPDRGTAALVAPAVRGLARPDRGRCGRSGGPSRAHAGDSSPASLFIRRPRRPTTAPSSPRARGTERYAGATRPQQILNIRPLHSPAVRSGRRNAITHGRFPTNKKDACTAECVREHTGASDVLPRQWGRLTTEPSVPDDPRHRATLLLAPWSAR
jgi:hypothetical protein